MKNLSPSKLALAGRMLSALLMLLAFLGKAHAQCDQTIVADTLTADYRGNPVGFCIDLDFMVAIRSDRFIDGVQETGFPDGCDFDSLVYYPYGTFPGAGTAGPYELIDWTVDGNSLNVIFSDINDLVAQMNAFNPAGGWVNDQLTRNIVGGEDGSTYSPMIIEQMNTSTRRTVNPNISRVANGTLIAVDGAGFHEYVVDDPNTGCRDTLTLFLRPVLDDIQLEIFTDFEEESEVFCLDNSGLLGAPQAATICGAATDGVLNDQGNYCYTYTPNPGHSGTDVICIEVCDDTVSPSGPLCQRTIISMITRSAPNFTTDTVRFQMTNVDTTVCLNAVIDFGGMPDNAQVCGPVPAGLTILPTINGCVDILPDASFSGPAMVCVSHCIGTVCDTTILDFNVLSPCDLGLFASETDTIPSQGNPATYCLPVDQTELNSYSITIDGQVYGGPVGDCDFEQEFFYNYAPLFGQGNSGPYSILRWTVNGQNFSGAFQDPAELETFMRTNDPAGNWRIDAAGFSIDGGSINTTYGAMVIIHDASGSQSDLFPNTIDVPRGATIELPGDGTYVIEVMNPSTGCMDELTLTIGQTTTETPTVQTLNVTVIADSVSATTCLFTTPRAVFAICEDVSNGTTTFDANDCVVYRPNPGFVGMDTLCVTSCDVPGGPVCDTTFVIFDVIPETSTVQTLNVTVIADSVSATTCLFTTPRAVFAICEDVSNGTTTFDANDCVVYRPNPGFVGMDTLCVTSCDVPGGPVCDTTFVIFEVIPETSTVQTLNVTVIADSVSATTCLFTTPRAVFAICEDVSNGTTTFDANDCVVYRPNPGFVGMDTLCVTSCDVPGGPVCDTTFVIFDVVPPMPPNTIDTIRISNFGDAPFNLCNGLPIIGPFSSVSICGVTGPFTAEVSPDGQCVVADPTDGVTGVGEICVTFCDNAVPANCQDVLFIITQTPSCAPPLFAQDTVVVGPSFGSVDYCLANGADLAAYEIFVNGDLTVPTTDPDCGGSGGGGGGGGQDFYFYPLLFINDGPLRIDAWDINGNTILNVSTTDFAQLADTMSALDPGNDWVYDIAEQGLVASSAVGNYSQLILFDLSFGTTYTIPLETINRGGGGGGGSAQGSVITLADPGVYDIELIALDGSCGDRLVINRESSIVPTRDTVTFFAVTDQGAQDFCINNSELSTIATSIRSCSDPLNGTMTFPNFNCVSYTPDPGFIGMDTACVIMCTNGGLLCDTTDIIFDVSPTASCPEIWTATNASSTTADCSVPMNVCLPAFPDEFFNYTVSVDGVVQTGALACGADTLTIYSYADVAGQGQAGPYRIEDYNLTSGTYTTNLADVNALVDSLNQWDPNGGWSINPSNLTIIGGVSGFAYDTIDLRQIATDTLNRLVPVTTLLENQLGFDLDVGSYAISVTDTRTNCTDTLRYNVICVTNNECPDLTAANGTDFSIVDCTDLIDFEVLSPTTDPAQLEVLVDGNTVTSATSTTSISVSLGEGVYEVLVVDPVRSCASTFTVTVTCGECPGPLTETSLAQGADCTASTIEVCLPAAPDVLQAYAITIDGQAYTGALGDCEVSTTNVLDVLAIPAAGAAGPYQVDSFGINGLIFSATVASMQALADTLSAWDDSGTWRYDANEMIILGGNELTSYSALFITQVSTSASAQVPVTQQQIAQGTVITIPGGAGERMLTFDNGVDCVQEASLTITCTTPSVLVDTILVNGVDTLCVDVSELTGPIVSLVDVCADSAGVVDFDFTTQLGCVTVTGLASGTVDACLVACDATGVCDTTFYTVVVLPDVQSGGLDAVDDFVPLRLDQVGTISVTANDTFIGALSSITIEQQTVNGIAVLDSDGTLTYRPNAGECGFTDSLIYQICQGTLCDRALVLIEVRCEPVEVYNGFSPNGDGLNDQLRFIGIEDFPNNKLTVYNRWGNEVHVATNYQNDWEGTWDGKRLIDGTYFWLLEIDGEEPLTGYVQINR